VPVVRIRALPQPESVEIAAALSAVTTELAQLLGEEPQGSWATWETIQPGHYAEGSDVPATQPRHTHPPLVAVTAFEGRSAELAERMLNCVAETLARELGLGEGNVFVTYDEALSGRVYTGGRILRS
jgi:phenylpyruvate tautomerase PptA (4-oxalocrotonate tautomerase family)